MSTAPPQPSAETLRVARLQPAYRQVASQLRTLILAGGLYPITAQAGSR